VTLIFGLLSIVALLFLIALVGRLVLDWVQQFSRDWRPRGVVLVVAEAAYSVTDPPLRALRRVIPPLRLGQIQLDLAFTVLLIAAVLVWQVLTGLSVSA
jgi:YggT family protein